MRDGWVGGARKGAAVLFPGRSFSAVGFGKEQLGYDGIGVYGIITKMGGLKRIDISISSREDEG